MMILIGCFVLLCSVVKEDMVLVMLWLIMLVLIGLIIGLLVGGVIVMYLDWCWIFYFNLLIGIFGVVLVMWYIGEVCEEWLVVFDVVGFVLLGVVLGCLLFGFEMISWMGELLCVLVLIGVGLVVGLCYIWYVKWWSDLIFDLLLMWVLLFWLLVMGGLLIWIM